MASDEEIEKIRQEIMRFRELLNIMRLKLEDGERAYAQLLAGRSAEEMSSLMEKDLQWKVAEALIADLSPLRKATMTMRFETRNLEAAFEELHDIIVSG